MCSSTQLHRGNIDYIYPSEFTHQKNISTFMLVYNTYTSYNRVTVVVYHTKLFIVQAYRIFNKKKTQKFFCCGFNISMEESFTVHSPNQIWHKKWGMKQWTLSTWFMARASGLLYSSIQPCQSNNLSCNVRPFGYKSTPITDSLRIFSGCSASLILLLMSISNLCFIIVDCWLIYWTIVCSVVFPYRQLSDEMYFMR